MDGKSSINYGAVPSAVAYKRSLAASSDHIVQTRKISILPSSGGGTYGDGSGSQDLTVYLQDPSEGSFLHPDSVYMTANIQTLAADGSAVTTGNFEVSANDVVERVQVRGMKSRVQLADCQNFNVYSAAMDKLKYDDYYLGANEAGRGMGNEAVDAAGGTNLNFGGSSKGAIAAAGLGAGTTQFKIDLSKVPLFSPLPGAKKSLMLPLGVSGGFELNVRFAPTSQAFVGYKTDNTTPTTTVKYSVTNVRLHATVSYMSQAFMTMFKQSIAAGQMSIPYMSYIGLQHNPKSTNETIRVGSSLEHLNSIFITHRVSADVSGNISKYSISHFGNAGVSELQAISGGVTVPSQPLVATTGAAANPLTTGQAEEELCQALENIGLYYPKSTRVLERKNTQLATSSMGTGGGAPTFAEVKAWTGKSILGLPMSSGTDIFSSVYNRSSSGSSTSRKADLNLNLKYLADPSAFTANIFLVHANIMQFLPNGQIIPEQLTF